MSAAVLYWLEIVTFWLNIKYICIFDESIIRSSYTAGNHHDPSPTEEALLWVLPAVPLKVVLFEKLYCSRQAYH